MLGAGAFAVSLFVACTGGVAGILPGLAVTAAVNALLFGTPLRSGYGGIAEIFDLDNMVPNLARYPTWALQTYSPFIFLGLIAPFLTGTSDVFKRTAWFTIGVPALLFVSYLFYTPFDHGLLVSERDERINSSCPPSRNVGRQHCHKGEKHRAPCKRGWIAWRDTVEQA